MANKILIEGKSGTGKSFAARNLDPKTTFIICADKKALPFQGWKKNYIEKYDEKGNLTQDSNFIRTNDFAQMERYLKLVNEYKKEVRVIIIDTISMAMNNAFMARAKETGWDKYTEMALQIYNFINMLDGLRDDLTIIVCSQVEVSDSLGVEKRTFQVPAGKIMKEKITVPSMFTVVLETVVRFNDSQEAEYLFLTQNDGNNDAKSPAGMFPEKYIANDYKLVLDCIDKYENG